MHADSQHFWALALQERSGKCSLHYRKGKGKRQNKIQGPPIFNFSNCSFESTRSFPLKQNSNRIKLERKVKHTHG